jgi:hypothetical protein
MTANESAKRAASEGQAASDGAGASKPDEQAARDRGAVHEPLREDAEPLTNEELPSDPRFDAWWGRLEHLQPSEWYEGMTENIARYAWNSAKADARAALVQPPTEPIYLCREKEPGNELLASLGVWMSVPAESFNRHPDRYEYIRVHAAPPSSAPSSGGSDQGGA